MTYYLVESIWLTIIVAVGGAGVLLFVGRNMEPARRGKLWLAWIGCTAGLYVLQRGVTTQREEVRIQLDRFIHAITLKKFDKIGECVSRNYSSPEFDRKAFIEWMQAKLQVVDVDNTLVRRCDIVITGDIVEMQLTAAANIRYQGMAGGIHHGNWTLTWERDGQTWKIVRIAVQSIDDHAYGSLKEINP